jgi:peptide/nickel transport system substrate-binding protein
LFAWYSGLDPSPFPQAMSSQIPTDANGKNGLNYTAYQNDIVDQLSLTSLEELDVKNIYANEKKIQKILMEELPMLPLFFRVDVSSCHQALVNYHPLTGTSNAELWYWNK